MTSAASSSKTSLCYLLLCQALILDLPKECTSFTGILAPQKELFCRSATPCPSAWHGIAARTTLMAQQGEDAARVDENPLGRLRGMNFDRRQTRPSNRTVDANARAANFFSARYNRMEHVTRDKDVHFFPPESTRGPRPDLRSLSPSSRAPRTDRIVNGLRVPKPDFFSSRSLGSISPSSPPPPPTPSPRPSSPPVKSNVTPAPAVGQPSVASSSGRKTPRRVAEGAVRGAVDPSSVFEENELVVHSQHGIAKFLRVEFVSIKEEAPKPFMVLQFADGVLKESFAQQSMVTRYFASGVGYGAEEPKLDSLSRPEVWKKRKAKARRTIKKLAHDVVKLQAVRKQNKRERYKLPERQADFEEAFPYEPTGDQVKAFRDIELDLCERDIPMDRLVCGDVGFGKTEVAMRALFLCVAQQRQAVLLAPTTVLAMQHLRTLEARFQGFGVRAALLTRFLPAKARRELLLQIAAGDVDILVGTHAVLSSKISFGRLGLVVVDEEQRFGVNHKEKLKTLSVGVDVLTLSATPIPRTLHMAMSGLRDMTVMQTPPRSKKEVETRVSKLSEPLLLKALQLEMDRAGQSFCVVPRIADIEHVVATIARLLPAARVLVAHGELKDLDERLIKFSQGGADVLVSTPIIESGLDIHSANTIVVFNSHYFGLSSLYQLRGRVGRGSTQAFALFTYPPDAELTLESQQRLAAISRYTSLGSGYELAQRDLEIRGAGSLLGAEQSGEANEIGVQLYMQMLREIVAEMEAKTVKDNRAIDETINDQSETV